MKSITKIIIGILGIAAIGLVTYFVISKEKNPSVTEKKITSPDKDTVATAKVIQDAMFEKIKEALSIDGEEFTLTKEEGVYTNSTNDKMLIIKEDVWKKMIHKIQEKIKNIAKDCNQQYEMPELSEYKFVGLLSYYADSKNMKKTTAYGAIEIKNGNAKSYAGGEICCACEGEPLVTQKVDAVVIK